MIFVYSLGLWCICVWWVASYIAKLWAKYYNFEQNFEHNRLAQKELPERKIGRKKLIPIINFTSSAAVDYGYLLAVQNITALAEKSKLRYQTFESFN